MDKVQKIREEVERIQLYTQSEVLKQVLDYIDEVQKEPISVWYNASIKYPLTGKEIIVLKDDKIYYGKYIGDSYNIYVRAEIQLIDDMAQTNAIIDYLTEKDKWIYVEDLLNLSNVQRTVKNRKEPISKELEYASEKYACRFSSSKYGHDKVKDAFIAGDKWKEEQMMAKAINARATSSLGSPCIAVSYWADTGLTLGDKCKIIVIMED